jgi:hypothetical protein
MKGNEPMNRMTITTAYLAMMATGKPRTKWIANYIPLADGETGEITIVLYADTYEEAHLLMWKHKPQHYANGGLRKA